MARILAAHAHPDDVETLVAGTLALLAERGHEIVIATLTAGDCGSPDLGREETARVRRAEAATAAAMIGAQYLCLGMPDLAVFNDDTSRRAVTALLRAVRPEIVIAAAPNDYHPDHEAASALVRDACFAAPVGNYVAGDAPPLSAIPHLYFADPIGLRERDGRLVTPDFAVDITAVMEIKRRMLEAHESQVAWLARQHAVSDATAGMVRMAERRGRDFSARYAEGFRHYRGEPYPRTPLLQELIGAALRQRAG